MDLLMPQLGETVSEGTVSQWFKQVGDTVAAGEPLFEIETDKTSMAVEATEAGVLTEIAVAAGQTVAVGARLGVLSARVAASARPKAAVAAPAKAKGTAAAAPPAPAARIDPFEEVRTAMPGFGPAKAAGAEGLRVTPLARRLIAQGGIDLAAVAAAVRRAGGSRIAKADVLALLDGGAAAQPADAGELVALNRIRRATARHLAKAWAEVPHVFQAVEVDFHRVERARKALNAAHAETWGLRLTYLPFVARAVCLAVKDFPLVNARLEGGQLRTSRRVHLGIAVDLDHAGLVVPVIRGAEDLTVVGLARAVADLVAKARAGGLMEGDLAGGTYTISNSGTFDTLFTAPIVNAPQVAILSTDGVRKKPVVVEDAEDGDRVAIRPVGVVGQSFDHRAFDGAYSAAFLARVRAILETTDWARAAD